MSNELKLVGDDSQAVTNIDLAGNHPPQLNRNRFLIA